MIVGRNNGGAGFVRDPLRDGFTIFSGAIVGDDSSAVGAGGREL